MVAGVGPAKDSTTHASAGGAVRLLCGPYRSGRADYVDSLMRHHAGRAILLVPTRKYAQRRIETVLLDGGLPGVWGRAVTTFEDFVVELLRAEGKPPVRVGDFERRLLMQDALARIQDSPALAALGAAGKTRGFVSQMLRVITEIKQAAVDPGQFRSYTAGAGNASWLDPVVADVYEAYQNTLLDAGVYDVPGMFWEAALICRDRRPRHMENVDVLLLDAFDDFTPSEFHLLSMLRPYVNLLAFGLNCDTDPNHSDLYAGVLRTARRIEQEFGAAIENFDSPEPQTCTEYAAASIFWRDQPVPPPKALARDLDIVPCADAVGELEWICRRVKRLLHGGHAVPGEIAVVYPSVGGFASTVRAVFDEFGVPARILTSPMLWESSVGAFALAFLEAINEWRRDTVVDVLVSPWFLPGRAHVEAVRSLARIASVVSGAAEWQARLEGLAARIDRGGPEAPHLPRIPKMAEALTELRDAVNCLAAHDNAFPQQATAGEFAMALKQILHELKVDEAVATHPLAEIRAREEAALEAALHLLAAWQNWNRNPVQITRAAFVSDFRRALQEVSFGLQQPRDAVVCMDAQAVRHLQFDYVFFAGVNEGELPGPPHLSAVYSQQDIENLARAGIELQNRYAHVERELLRFHHVLCTARKHLTISWRTLSARGQEDHPSPYLYELMELFPGETLQAPMPRSTDFVPPLGEASSWRDVRNAVFSAHQDAAGFRPKFPHLELAAQIETARHDLSPFGRYDGVLSDSKVADALRGQFGAGHVFSVSQIETYAECPFSFFVKRVLGVEEAEAPTAEFDPAVRGSIIHDVLHRLHLKHHKTPACLIPNEVALPDLDDLLEEVFRRHAWRSGNTPPAVLEAEKRHVKSLLVRYLHNERANNETQWRPTYFEAAFGKAYAEAECSLRVERPFKLDLEGGAVLFAGRIDRIDVLEGANSTVRIVDYKTSQVPQVKDVNEGRSLQLPLYALAVEKLLMSGSICAEALFLSVSKNERRRLTREAAWDDCANFRETISGYVEGIRAGRYVPAPGNPAGVCSNCSARRVCRYETGRVERKMPETTSEWLS